MSLPRLLLLVEDGSLGIEPVPELKKLRINHRHRESIKLHTDSELTIEGVCGDCLKLQADIAPGRTTECGVKVRRSPDGEEETAIVCQPAAGALKIYLTKSTLDDAVIYPRFTPQDEDNSKRYTNSHAAPFKLADSEPLKLHIFLDRSVLEVLANTRQCLTQRIYPTRSDSLGVSLFARGGPVVVNRVDASERMSTVAG